MTTREMVAELESHGIEVKYSVRKDGGIRITRIGTKSYKGSAGNKAARQILGIELSKRRAAQLKKIRSRKGQFGHRKRVTPLDDETIKRIRRIQRMFRKNKINRTGIVTQRNYRYVLKHSGKAEADRRLSQAEQYAKGLAYEQNIEALIKRLTLDNNKINNPDIAKTIEILEQNKKNILVDDLKTIIEEVYEYEQTKLAADRNALAAKILILVQEATKKKK